MESTKAPQTGRLLGPVSAPAGQTRLQLAPWFACIQPEGYHMNLTYILSAGIVLAISGCMGAGASNLSYDGQANGTHSDTATCDDQGSIKGSGTIPDGSVLITLKDSAGKQLFQQSFKESFTLAAKTVSGASGTWTLDAQRSGDDLVGDSFSGKYDFNLDC